MRLSDPQWQEFPKDVENPPGPLIAVSRHGQPNMTNIAILDHVLVDIVLGAFEILADRFGVGEAEAQPLPSYVFVVSRGFFLEWGKELIMVVHVRRV